MEAEVDAGRVRAIGISNFNESQIKRILDCAKIHPAVLQVEMHALHQQRPLREFCSKICLPIVAYSPLGSPAATSHFRDKYGHLRCVHPIHIFLTT
jgi:alcohol dehydrogenase (NADP+)